MRTNREENPADAAKNCFHTPLQHEGKPSKLSFLCSLSLFDCSAKIKETNNKGFKRKSVFPWQDQVHRSSPTTLNIFLSLEVTIFSNREHYCLWLCTLKPTSHPKNNTWGPQLCRMSPALTAQHLSQQSPSQPKTFPTPRGLPLLLLQLMALVCHLPCAISSASHC